MLVSEYLSQGPVPCAFCIASLSQSSVLIPFDSETTQHVADDAVISRTLNDEACQKLRLIAARAIERPEYATYPDNETTASLWRSPASIAWI
jgi:hypothetical protein